MASEKEDKDSFDERLEKLEETMASILSALKKIVEKDEAPEP